MLYVDRIENGSIICEDGQGRKTVLSPQELSGEAADGDVLVRRQGKYVKSQRLTEKRRAEIKAMQDKLFK